MNRLWRMTGGLALVTGAVLLLNASGADDKPPSIKDIMNKAHKGGDSLIQAVGKDLKADTPDWEDAAKKSKELLELGSALGKNNPPKGEKDSWEKLTKLYADTAKELDDAVQKKDKDAALTAHKKLAGSCMNCHRAHRTK
jgi:hypothetical protein